MWCILFKQRGWCLAFNCPICGLMYSIHSVVFSSVCSALSLISVVFNKEWITPVWRGLYWPVVLCSDISNSVFAVSHYKYKCLTSYSLWLACQQVVPSQSTDSYMWCKLYRWRGWLAHGNNASWWGINKIRWEVLHCICMAQDRDDCQAAVNTLTKFRVPLMADSFYSS